MAVMRACLAQVIQRVYHLITPIHERGADREKGRKGGEKGKKTSGLIITHYINVCKASLLLHLLLGLVV